MPLPDILKADLRLPVVAAPLFIISHPPLVLAQCKAGVVGSFPALNARPESQLDEWLAEITEDLAAHNAAHPERPAAPFAVNQIVHRSNRRLEHDLRMCVKYKVPIVISSLGAVPEVNEAIHSYGGIVLHDIISIRHAHSAIDKGADGLIAVAAGAGGHAGPLSPFALVQEIRSWFDGPLLLSGRDRDRRRDPRGAGHGRRPRLYRLALHRHAGSARRRRLQADDREERRRRHRLFELFHRHPRQLPETLDQPCRHGSGQPAGGRSDRRWTSTAAARRRKAWRDIWGAGQGIGAVRETAPVADLVDRLEREYGEARRRLCRETLAWSRAMPRSPTFCRNRLEMRCRWLYQPPRPVRHWRRRPAALAQLVEHIIRNDGVACSSHASGTRTPP